MYPKQYGGMFFTDGGIETTLIYCDGFDLPGFAAFNLMKHESGLAAIKKYFRTYAELAKKYNVGFIIDSPIWRANSDWGLKLGY